MAQKEKQEDHPMIQEIMRSLRKADDGTYIFDSIDLLGFKKRGLEISDSDELQSLVSSIVNVSYFLAEKQSSPGAAEALLETTGAQMVGVDRAEWDRYVAAVRAQQDEAAFLAAWAKGRTILVDGWEQAVVYALEG